MARVLTEEQQLEYERLQQIKEWCAYYDQMLLMKQMNKKEYTETMKLLCLEVEELMHKYRVPLLDIKDGWNVVN